MIPCTTNIFGVKRCSFEPRYDVSAPTMNVKGETTPSGFAEVIEASKARTYVYDICVACGKTRRRNDGCSGDISSRS